VMAADLLLTGASLKRAAATQRIRDGYNRNDLGTMGLGSLSSAAQLCRFFESAHTSFLFTASNAYVAATQPWPDPKAFTVSA